MAYFWWAQNRAPQINFGDEIDLNQKVLTVMKNLFDIFWCKNDRWIQKIGFEAWK